MVSFCKSTGLNQTFSARSFTQRESTAKIVHALSYGSPKDPSVKSTPQVEALLCKIPNTIEPRKNFRERLMTCLNDNSIWGEHCKVTRLAYANFIRQNTHVELDSYDVLDSDGLVVVVDTSPYTTEAFKGRILYSLAELEASMHFTRWVNKEDQKVVLSTFLKIFLPESSFSKPRCSTLLNRAQKVFEKDILPALRRYGISNQLDLSFQFFLSSVCKYTLSNACQNQKLEELMEKAFSKFKKFTHEVPNYIALQDLVNQLNSKDFFALYPQARDRLKKKPLELKHLVSFILTPNNHLN